MASRPDARPRRYLTSAQMTVENPFKGHKVPFARHTISEAEIEEVVRALRSDWITTGPRAQQFADEFAAYVGAPAALALNSGTAALHVALAALGVGPGDGVVTTTMTFCSTVHVIEHLGARPILVDVEPDTLNIDPTEVERAIREGDGIKALLPVHYAGHPCDMGRLLDLAAAADLAVVEDAAHAIPASFAGEPVGSVQHDNVRRAVAFSFYATKNLTTGEGGMLTADADLIDEGRIWSLHGMNRDAWRRYAAEGSWFYEVTRPGFKYNMTDLAAALGLQQLRRLADLDDRRRAIVEQYNDAFAALDTLELPVERSEVGHAWHLYVLRLHLDRLRIGRAEVIEELGRRGVQTSVHFIPIHLHPYYRDRYGYAPEDFPVAYRAYQRMLSLPLHGAMTDADVEAVIAAVLDVSAAHGR